MIDAELMKEVVRLLSPDAAEAWRKTAEELELEALRRFLDHGNLDQLGWQHKYQAMNLRNYADILEEKAKKDSEQ